MDHVPGKALPGLVIVGGNGLALIYAKTGMMPREQNLDQARSDLILSQQHIQEHVTKQPIITQSAITRGSTTD